jgi:predicted amidohydrolase
MLSSAGVLPGDIVVLPEMFDTGFSFAIERTSDADDQTLHFLKQLSRELSCTIQGSRTVVREDGRGLNRATITGPTGEVLVEYDKVHLFSPGREPERFAGGDRVVTFAWAGLTACPAVCYDLRFPELFRRGLAMGAELFAIGANWPTAREAHRRALSIARAIENQAFVFSVNRCGRDPHLEYAGGSLAVSPRGEILAEAGDREQVVSVEIRPEDVREWRQSFSAWRDGRL